MTTLTHQCKNRREHIFVPIILSLKTNAFIYSRVLDTRERCPDRPRDQMQGPVTTNRLPKTKRTQVNVVQGSKANFN